MHYPPPTHTHTLTETNTHMEMPYPGDSHRTAKGLIHIFFWKTNKQHYQRKHSI